ncbi:MAG TPA: carboxypeptidase-like regulatory domain-containing protein [Candidatus Acidoferrales bacterium]|nr:carboxypeptidase-like regulatory domain-containing protein [Candidatus Acidoferrales bacterium]
MEPKRVRSIAKSIVILAVVVLASGSAHAQRAIQSPRCKGVIHGIVSDQQGRPVPGISVTLSPVGVDLSVLLPKTEANQSGEYRFTHVCPGRYTVLPDGLTFVLPRDSTLLSGRRAPEAKLSDKNTTADIPVKLPERPRAR